MRIATAGEDDLDAWSRMRAALWPDGSPEEHRRAVAAALAAGDGAAWIARDADGDPVGVAEASLRSDHVNGCDTSPVAFLEGLYVAPAHRRHGVARALVEAVAAWGRAAGCSEFASDAPLDNAASHAMHGALGFAETERVVFFRRPL